jgi:HlyD family secretion protein
MKHKLASIVTIAVLSSFTAGAFYVRGAAGELTVGTDVVSRGAIVNNIAASGTLEAVTTVEVGTQVSGMVESLNADFNSIVKKGQVLARIEPSLFQSAVDQAQANLVRTEADVQGLDVDLADAAVKLQRARELAARQLIPATDLDTASVARDSLDAQIKSGRAAVAQARAALGQAQVNLEKTVVFSPIDGIVIARNVDVGQTVAASLQAPTLFVIAADLSRMQVNASIDESDVGQIAAGQKATFTVDAYQGKRFSGTVAQVRLNPTVVSNVVTYAAIISAPNPLLELKPGMTANVTVEVSRRDNALRVPNAALRFRPSDEVLKALGLQRSSATPPKGATVVWQQSGGTIQAVPVRVGASDGVNTELVDDALPEGATLVTRVTLPGAVSSTATKATSSPLIPTMGPRR